jgi:broad specificity phosphatase PhoE
MRCIFLAAVLAVSAVTPSEAETLTETIVLLRHGEKPQEGLGQLNCRGFNRALALPARLSALFGKPKAIFAPDPAKRKTDGDGEYDYVRPLATIEPTAIAFGLPVNTDFGFKEIDKLQKALEGKDYRNATVLVAWEHRQIVKLSRGLLADNGGDETTVPKWSGDDFDSIYVVRITQQNGHNSATFERKVENLDDQPQTCP